MRGRRGQWRLLRIVLISLLSLTAAACADRTDGPGTGGPGTGEPAPTVAVDPAPADDAELEAALCAAADGGPDSVLISLLLALDLPSETELGYRLGALVQSTAPTCPVPKADLEVLADDVYGRLAPQLASDARSLTTEPVRS